MTTATTENQSTDVRHSADAYQPTFVPRFDIWEGDDSLILQGDVPGVSVEDLDIRLEKNELTLHGKVAPRLGGPTLRREYEVGDFHRTFAIEESIDSEKISAEIRNGVLTLHLPKIEQAKPRKIEVQTS